MLRDLDKHAQVVDHLRWQADACDNLGSPFYAHLLRRLADDAAQGGITALVLAGQSGDLKEQALALRLLGGVHRLVLSGNAPGLAAHYQSVGGDGDTDAAATRFLEVLTEQQEAVHDALQRAPQTNEVGRAAALVGVLCHLVNQRSLPIRLLEIGASAGLNLRCDRFEVRTEDGRPFGPTGSRALLERAWRGQLPPMTQNLEIIERRGCDLHPVDPTSAAGVLTLTSYMWPDQSERLRRLRGALEVAADVPATVEAAAAAEFLDRAELRPGSWLVVWHSIMWQYLHATEQAAVLRRLDDMGEAASAESPLAHVSFEPRSTEGGLEFRVTVRTWPDVGLGPDERVLGRAAPHGIPVDWAWVPIDVDF